MREIIRSLRLTNQHSRGEIEQLLLSTGDFTPEFYIIRRMGGFISAALEIHEYLNRNN